MAVGNALCGIPRLRAKAERQGRRSLQLGFHGLESQPRESHFGGSIVIGGIYEQTKINNVVRTPFFGDLPYVGRLFQNKSGSNGKKELLIFVTPKIVREGLVTASP